jgi:hypothetical protein
MSDNEGETFTRKHKTLLRRESSFRRMQNIPQRVDEWFHADDALHRSWDAFVAKHRASSATFTPPENNNGTLIEADHKARQVHEEFCETFEAALAQFLDTQKVSMDQFQEAFRISRDEEARDGQHFYRWPDVVEFEVFLTLMRGGSSTLIKHIDELADTARQDHRRRSSFFPLLVETTPPTFATLDEAAANAIKLSGAALNMSRPQLKELTRWKLKLASKTLNANGVYDQPPRDEVEWSRYLAFLTSRMTDKAFEAFLTQLREQLPASERIEAGDDVVAVERSALLRCFHGLDDLNRGWIDLGHTCTMIAKADVVPDRALKRATLKWRHIIDQRSRQAAVLPAAGEPSEAAECSEADETSVRLQMLDALDFLKEVLSTASGPASAGSLVERLDRVTSTVRDRG